MNSNHLDHKLRMVKEECKARFKHTEAADPAKTEDNLKKAQEELHLHPGDKLLVDIECIKTEVYRRLKKVWELGLK